MNAPPNGARARRDLLAVITDAALKAKAQEGDEDAKRTLAEAHEELRRLDQQEADERLSRFEDYAEQHKTGPPKFLRLKAVMEATGLAESTIFFYMKTGRFPKSFLISKGRKAWLESDIIEWQREKLAAAGKPVDVESREAV